MEQNERGRQAGYSHRALYLVAGHSYTRRDDLERQAEEVKKAPRRTTHGYWLNTFINISCRSEIWDPNVV